MIREYQTKDLDSVMSLWLSGNQQAHHFIDPQFYQNNYEFVKMLMPASTIFVQDIDGVRGFIGLMDNYISGLFVDEYYRHQNIGKALIAKAKQLHNELTVIVYKQNSSAIAFFQSQGFEVIGESINEETLKPEVTMSCVVNHTVKIGKCAL